MIKNKSIQIYGPFSTSYSLAEVNRQLGYALADKGFDVSFVDDKKFTDNYPGPNDLKIYPRIKDMMKPKFHADIAIWNRFPHDYVDELDAEVKVLYIAWEASLMSKESIDKFNANFDLVLAASEFTKDILIRSGIKLPVFIVPNAINIDLLEASKDYEYQINSNKKFKFLNISSGVPRKGLDVLVKAYFEEFTSDDDVTLVLKTNIFDNIDSDILKLKERFGNKSPEIIRIGENWEDEKKLLSLYYKADTYVCSPRAEGFNLPALSAMYAKLPVVITNYSGHLDFCNPENSYLVDYTLTDGSAVFNIPNALWAEPSVESLRAQMRKALNEKGSDIQQSKIDKAFKRSSEYTWDKSAQTLTEVLDAFEETKYLKTKNLGVFSTWNTKCGIAEYSKHFYTPIKQLFNNVYFFGTKAGIRVAKDDEFVSRIWDELQQIDLEAVEAEIVSKKIDIFHVQYNTGFYNLEQLVGLLKHAKKTCEKVYVTMHSLDEIEKNLNNKKIKELVLELNTACDTVFVHRDSDIELLSSLGLKNCQMIPHGNSIYPDEDRDIIRKSLNIYSKHVISSHGFLLPDKAYIEIIRAVKILKEKFPDILYLMATAVHSTNASSSIYYEECMNEIEKLGLKDNVVLIKDFLSIDEMMVVLHASDMIVMMRKNSTEGASGAVRFPLTSMRPVIINDARIFKDVKEYTYSIPDLDSNMIAETVEKLYTDANSYEGLKPKINEYLQKISWPVVSLNYIKYIQKNYGK